MSIWASDDPWPNDSTEDRARRVAASYRRVIELATQGLVIDLAATMASLDEQWTRLRCGWIRPTYSPLRTEDWVTETEIAELFCIPAKRVYMWGYRGLVPVHIINGQRHYCIGHVVTFYAERRKTRSRNAKSHTGIFSGHSDV